MFGAAAAIGIAGLYQTGLRPDLRSLAFALFIVCAAGALQLVPVPTRGSHAIEPGNARHSGLTRSGICRRHSLGTAFDPSTEHGRRDRVADGLEPVPARPFGADLAANPPIVARIAGDLRRAAGAVRNLHARNQPRPDLRLLAAAGWRRRKPVRALHQQEPLWRLDADDTRPADRFAVRAVRRRAAWQCRRTTPRCWRGSPPGPRTVSCSRGPS